MKNQALFSSKNKSKELKCHLLQFLCGSLRVNLQGVEIFIKDFDKIGNAGSVSCV